ncbi:HAMP domain-containing histidine kinase [Listeria grandensis]|uniref:histidine kinase n=1 Tax=Listeria grandensis TaxID=1494963 RepID=A0A7X1CNN7_9LIST|nr:HAMP domain-containing sensor histidine kinase [Listeria grandensis]MBC1935092.1 HAMP domain-containing histidine kinase [Listeria grandensis]
MKFIQKQLGIIIIFIFCLVIEVAVLWLLLGTAFSTDFLYTLVVPILIFSCYLLYRFYQEKRDFPVSAQAERFKAELENERKLYRERTLDQELQNQQFIDFMTSWVHDIKTPLTVLNLSVDTKQKQQVIQIESKINQMLFYAKQTSFYEDLHLEKVQLNVLVEKLLKQYANLFINQKFTVDLNFEQVTPVLTDRLWTSFVLEQIIANALKYAGEGEQLIVTTAESDTVIWIEVKNTGSLIESADLPRIFERGYTGKTREFGKSTGMGLFLSKEIMGKLGGEIQATNDPLTAFRLVFRKDGF